MKAQFLVLVLTVIALITGCSKDGSYFPSTSPDPHLKVQGCDPSVINYDDRDTFALPFPVYLPENCFQEPILVTLYDVKSKGHINVAASCRFNDHAKLEIHITGTGVVTGNLYDSFTSVKHHYNGSLTGQGAQVVRDNISSTLTNLTTGATYAMSHTLYQTINANGDVTVDNVTFHPCE